MRVDRLSPEDLQGFSHGLDARAYEKLGAHVVADGVAFAVWAPNASGVSVIGSFNGWAGGDAPLAPVGDTGVWQGKARAAKVGDLYKYRVVSNVDGRVAEKADPYGFLHETPPCTASIVTASTHVWKDGEWMASRARTNRNALDAPMSIYEVHLGSWRRVPEEGNRSLGYREIAPLLADYLEKLGFTHVELMPVMEHPFFGSWGYQVTGYFAPSHRFGTPDDLRFLIDTLHQRGIGVILDWVPAHFPTDAHSLGLFDGTHLYEHRTRGRASIPSGTPSRSTTRARRSGASSSSSALYWLDEFHADGLRVDGVSSMLYLDYARSPGAWVPNVHGGHEDLAAVDFLRTLNERAYQDHPDVQIIAEESTAWPRVTKPTTMGGLGFGLKWDMGWMHDTLRYLADDPIYRQYHQNTLTFRSLYAYTENFVLPLSHDEVVYGKRSLLEKMPGDDWQKFANLRLLLSYMWSLPGKKLLFMGGEFAQRREWSHEASLDWHLMELPAHGQVAQLVGSLNHLYRTEPALHEGDTETHGFEWLDGSNAEESTLVFLRRGREEHETVLVALNFTPVPRHEYRVGVPEAGVWHEVLNSDAAVFGGSGQGNLGAAVSRPVPWNGRPHSILITLPPLAALFFRAGNVRDDDARPTGGGVVT